MPRAAHLLFLVPKHSERAAVTRSTSVNFPLMLGMTNGPSARASGRECELPIPSKFCFQLLEFSNVALATFDSTGQRLITLEIENPSQL